jgi:hypothetical protein
VARQWLVLGWARARALAARCIPELTAGCRPQLLALAEQVRAMPESAAAPLLVLARARQPAPIPRA